MVPCLAHVDKKVAICLIAVDSDFVNVSGLLTLQRGSRRL